MPSGLAILGKLTGKGEVEVAAEGARVRLSDGREMLDFGSYAVALLGHRHPKVVDAVERQLHTMPLSTRALSNPVTAQAAETVVDYLGGGLSRVWFGLNGSDAVEASLKLARLSSGRTHVLAVEGGFHGKSLGALSVTHSERYRHGHRTLLGPVSHLDPADPHALDRLGIPLDEIAALIYEPVQGEAGVRALPLDVIRTWAERVRAGGGFVISDEIQCGLRRCGPRSIALDAGLPTDAVLLGKALGGGVVPLSAAVCTEELFQPLLADPLQHTTTFGGHPLSCAALPAALDAVEASAHRLPDLEDRIGSALARAALSRPDLVSEVRGRGLLWGISFASDEAAGEVLAELCERGLLVSPCLGRPTILRLMPPLTVSDGDLDDGLKILCSTIADVTVS
ncbi:aspartate aminotransferase family protein [Streptomyces nojiriensis]